VHTPISYGKPPAPPVALTRAPGTTCNNNDDNNIALTGNRLWREPSSGCPDTRIPVERLLVSVGVGVLLTSFHQRLFLSFKKNVPISFNQMFTDFTALNVHNRATIVKLEYNFTNKIKGNFTRIFFSN